MFRILTLTIVIAMLLPMTVLAQGDTISAVTEDPYAPGHYRQHAQGSIASFSCPSATCSVIKHTVFADIVKVLREVQPQNSDSTIRWLEIEHSSGEVGYVIARYFEPLSSSTENATATPEALIEDEVPVRVSLRRGRSARHELVYASILATVTNTASFSLTDRLVTGNIDFTEEGEYRVLFRSFIIDENEEFSSIWDGLEVSRPTGSCRNFSFAEDGTAIVFLNCPGTVDFTFDTDGDYVSIIILRISE